MNHTPPKVPWWRPFLHPRWWATTLVIATIAWSVWCEYDYSDAIYEARAAGCHWDSREPRDFIGEDWRAAFRLETWTESYRRIFIPRGSDLASLRPLLLRLRPTSLSASHSENVNLNVLKGLTGLHTLDLSGCPALQNVDALKGLSGLQTLDLSGCPALQNVDGLKGLTGLQTLDLNGCPALQSVDGLKGLTGLQSLHLGGCTALQNLDDFKGFSGLESLSLHECTSLQNVDGLKGLTGLKKLFLYGCPKLPATAVAELRAALPKTVIYGP